MALDTSNTACYIIIEVRNAPGHDALSDAGAIRRAIHEYALEHGINSGDNIIRPDRDENPHTGKPEPIQEARDLMQKVWFA
jgi:hypothetical protein